MFYNLQPIGAKKPKSCKREANGMKTAGIICEYNPLHRGHAHLFSQARAAGADLILCAIMKK